MARKPLHTTFQSLLQYNISLYYNERDKNPKLRIDLHSHLKMARRQITFYKKELTQKYPEWDTAETQSALEYAINSITGIFTKEKQAEEKGNKIKKFKEEVMLRARTIIHP